LRAAPDAASTLLLARAALTNGDASDAQRMIASAHQAGADESALAPLDAALTALMGARGADGAMAMKRRIDNAGVGAARSAARDVTLLTALGAQGDDATQAFLAANTTTGGVPADAATMTALAEAVQRQAVGEVALLSALAIHPRPSRLDAASLAQVISALRAVGMESDARRLAVEAILAGAPAPPARRPAAAARPN